MKNTIKQLSCLAATTLILSACGGGSGSNNGNENNNTPSGNNPPPTPHVALGMTSGTVAIGKPLANADLIAIDGQGRRAQTQTDLNGGFKLDLTGFSAPVLLQANGASEDSPLTLHSVVTQQGTTNVTPLTDALVAMTSDAEPTACFEKIASCSNQLTETRLAQSLAQLRAALAPLQHAVGLNNPVDFRHDAFHPDLTGQDLLLEWVEITPGEKAGERVLRNRFGDRSVVLNREQTPTPLSISGTLPNLRGLDDLSQQLSTVFNGDDNAEERLKPLLSHDFNYSGMNGDIFAKMKATQYWWKSARFSRPQLVRCNSTTRCTIRLWEGIPSSPDNKLMEYAISREANGWMLAGNDYPVSLSVSLSADQWNTVNRATQAVSTRQQSSMNVIVSQYPENVYAGQPVVRSARLLVNGTPLIEMKENPQCSNGRLAAQPAGQSYVDCGSYFLEFSTLLSQQYNQALREGKAVLRLYANTDFTQQVGGDILPTQAAFTTAEMQPNRFSTLQPESLAALLQANGGSNLSLNWLQPKSLYMKMARLSMYGNSVGRNEFTEWLRPGPSRNAVESTSWTKNLKPELKTVEIMTLDLESGDLQGRTRQSHYAFQ